MILPLCSRITAYADDETTRELPSVFSKYFATPTGMNGFEEILWAGERLQESKAVYLPRATFTLARKRAFLADPAVKDAFVLLRRGLAKPINIPRHDPTDPDFPSPFALIRSLARLLAVEIYVCLADGRSDIAVANVTQGLALTYPLKSVNMVWGMVGGAMDSLMLTTLLEQAGTWNVRDCQRLQQLALKWLTTPNPAVEGLSAEREIALQMVVRYRVKWEELCEQLEYHYASEEDEDETVESLQAEEYANTLRTNPALRERVFGEMASMINAHFDQAYALMNYPTGRMEVKIASSVSGNWHPITLALGPALLSDAPTIIQPSVENRLQLQFLLIHAAIRHHRWENNRLPKSLEELHLEPRFLTDPFTAKPLLYELSQTRTSYRLASAGALAPGEDGKPDTRSPITLPQEFRQP